MPTSASALRSNSTSTPGKKTLEQELQAQKDKVVEAVPKVAKKNVASKATDKLATEVESDEEGQSISLVSSPDESSTSLKRKSESKTRPTKKKKKTRMESSDSESEDSDDSDVSFSALTCGLSEVEHISTSESDTIDEVIDFWKELPNDLYNTPREGGQIWKRTVEKAIKLSKKIKKIIKSLKIKKSKCVRSSLKKEIKSDLVMLKLAYAQFERFNEFFGPASSFVSMIINLT